MLSPGNLWLSACRYTMYINYWKAFDPLTRAFTNILLLAEQNYEIIASGNLSLTKKIDRFNLICKLPTSLFLDTFERCVFGNEYAIILSSELVALCLHMMLCSYKKPHLSKVLINIKMGNLYMRLNRSIGVEFDRCLARTVTLIQALVLNLRKPGQYSAVGG